MDALLRRLATVFAILGSAVPTPSLNGKVATNGRLNVSGF